MDTYGRLPICGPRLHDGWKSATGIIVYAAIVLILLAGVLIGPRLKLAEADVEAGESATRQPRRRSSGARMGSIGSPTKE